MKSHLEITGLRCEVLGLALLLVASIWQAQVSDWFDHTDRGWAAYIQEDVNLALLQSMHVLGRQNAATTQTERNTAWNEIDHLTRQAIGRAISERQSKERLKQGQAYVSGWIRLILFSVGALLVIIGKWFVLKHKANASRAHEGEPEPKSTVATTEPVRNSTDSQ